jgi:hypothetical protein
MEQWESPAKANVAKGHEQVCNLFRQLPASAGLPVEPVAAAGNTS